MSISRVGTFCKYPAILLLVWGISLPVAELAFRLSGDRPSEDLKGLYVQFAKQNYKLGPMVNTDAALAAGLVRVRTDELGLRCDESRRLAARAGESLDVLFVGDSQGFGNGVNYEETIAGSVALAAAQHGYRVGNSSVGGHSLASQLQLARWLVCEKHLRPAKFVLLLTPVMIRSSDQLNRAVVGEDGRLYGGRITLGARARLWVKTHLVIYSRIRDAVRNCGIGADPAKESKSVFEFYHPGPQQETVERTLQNTVTEFKEFAAATGASIEMVYLPLTVEAQFASLQNAAEKLGLTLDGEASYRVADHVANKLGVPLLDLRPVLREIQATKRPLNVKGDFHYSAELSRACGSNLMVSLNLMSPKKDRT